MRIAAGLSYLVPIVSFLSLASCSSPAPLAPDGPSNRTPVVFVHGLKGSVLEDERGDVRWITAGQGLGLSTPMLNLPLEWDGDTQKRDGLVARRPIDRITLIPGLGYAEIYGPFLRAMPAPFYPFAYDWRRDNLESLDALEGFVRYVRDREGGRKVRLIGHSNGGLLAWALVNRHPDWFESAWFAGVPFAGGVGFLPDLAIGQDNGLNRGILRPAVLATFPSVYTFFREDGRGLEGARFFDPEFWKKEGWGLFSERLSPDENQRALAFLAKTLPRAARFRALLVKAPVSYPPLHVIRSHARLTVTRLVRTADGHVNFKSAASCRGDGRVCADDALPPDGVRARIHETRLDHTELLNDPAIQALLQNP